VLSTGVILLLSALGTWSIYYLSHFSNCSRTSLFEKNILAGPIKMTNMMRKIDRWNDVLMNAMFM